MSTSVFRHLYVLSKWALVYYYGSESGLDQGDLGALSRPPCCDFLLPSADCSLADDNDAAVGLGTLAVTFFVLQALRIKVW